MTVGVRGLGQEGIDGKILGEEVFWEQKPQF